jgi:hypothetical protein
MVKKKFWILSVFICITANAGTSSWQHTSPYAFMGGFAEVNNTVYESTNAGIVKSNDAGQTWNLANYGSELELRGATALTIDSEGDLFAAGGPMSAQAQDQAQLMLQYMKTGTLPTPPAPLVIYELPKGQAQWLKQAITGLPTNGTIIIALAVDHVGNLFAGTLGGGFKLPQSSKQWISLPVENPSNPEIDQLLVDEFNNIYAVAGGGIFKIPNGQQSWVAVNQGLPAVSASKILVHGLAVTKDNTFYVATANGVYKLSPGEDTWTSISNGLPAWGIYMHNNHLISAGDITAIATDTSGNLYAVASGLGAYKLTSGGSQWVELPSAGFPNVPIYGLFVDTIGNIYLGAGSGTFMLSANYPL